MSAYVPDLTHIHSLVWAAIKRRDGEGFRYIHRGEPRWASRDTADAVGRMLLEEVIDSVQYRYPDCSPDDLPGTIPTPNPEDYTFDRACLALGPPDPIKVLLAIAGYEYQACEHPEWHTSEAKAYCEALRAVMIACLPGYDDAGTWSVKGFSEMLGGGDAAG